jgi:Tfp pilus assembly protein PilE
MYIKNMNKKTVSLIELIVVTAIIAVLCGVVTVSFSYIFPKKIEAAARQIVSALSWLRIYSISQHENMIAQFNQNQKTILFYHGTVNSANLIKTVRIPYAITTTPATDPLNLYFITIFDSGACIRRGLPDADFSDADLDDLIISFEGQPRVEVMGETGFIRYLP